MKVWLNIEPEEQNRLIQTNYDFAHNRAFWKAYRALPSDIRKQARKAYRLFRDDPHHPGLHFKRIHDTKPLYSVRISRDYRALGVRDEDTIIGLWIGSHAEYDKMLGSL